MLRTQWKGTMLALAAFGLLGGCATYPIAREYREAVRPGLTFPQVQQDATAYLGTTVIWGGKIIRTTNYKDHTEMTVLQIPLLSDERPGAAVTTEGRFIASTPDFLDPEIYKKGKRVTLAGVIKGAEKKPLGEGEYNYPVVDIKELYLWGPQPVSNYNYYGWGWYGYYDPFFWSYYPDWDFYDGWDDED